MSMQEEMERLRKEIEPKEETKHEVVEEEEIVDEVQEEEPTAEEVAEEQQEEPKKEEPKEAENAAYARLRYEAAEERRRREALEQRLADLEAAKNAPKVEEDIEPNKEENFEAWVEWKDKQVEKLVKTQGSELENLKKERAEEVKRQTEAKQYQEAISEFTQYENDFKSKAEDYEQVSQFYVGRIRESVKLLHPHLNEQQVQQLAAHQILKTAGTYAAQGLHPVERMYQDAKNMGYVAPKAEEKPKAKPNLEAIDKNKRRTTSGAALAGNNGKNYLGLTDVSDMTMAQFSKLTPEERGRLKREASGG